MNSASSNSRIAQDRPHKDTSDSKAAPDSKPHSDGKATSDKKVTPDKKAAAEKTDTIYAAGALIWRIKRKQLEVLLIHRPRYDDWSWPKGKLDPGETLPQTAVREVREEIGLSIQLGIPLPTVEYFVSNRPKQVLYWAAQASEQAPAPDGEEVDRFQWCTPQAAKNLLSQDMDLAPLEALERAYAEKALRTWPLILLRHAKAKPRSTWTKADNLRPLAATGKRQAAADKRLLLAWAPQHVISSPWDRCVETVTPYVKATGAKLKLKEALSEAQHHRKPAKTGAVLDNQVEKRRPVVLCVHRPTLPTLLTRLRFFLSSELSKKLPSSDPYLSPGEMLIIQFADTRAVSVERFKPFED